MRTGPAHALVGGLGALVWLALVLVPLGWLYARVAAGEGEATGWTAAGWAHLAGRSAFLAAGVAALSVALAWTPGRLLGTARRGGAALLAVVLAPLLLPRYVLYYTWSLLLAPTTALGRWLAVQPMEVARTVGEAASALVLLAWYWPLAALVLAHGWRSVDPEVLDAAALEAGRARRFWRVTLPLMARPLGLALAVCFAMVLSEYATFHLAGVETIGSALGVLYEQTGSAEAVARGALPLVAVAAVVGALLGRGVGADALHAPLDVPGGVRRWPWAVLAALVALSLVAPLALLALSVDDAAGLARLWRLEGDSLAASAASAALAAALALVMAGGVLALERLGRAAGAGDSGRSLRNVILSAAKNLAVAVGATAPARALTTRPFASLRVTASRSLSRSLSRSPPQRLVTAFGRAAGALAWLVQATLLAAMFLPGSLVGVALVRALAALDLPAGLGDGWWMPALGQAVRFAGVSLVVLRLARDSAGDRLAEMAAADGAGTLQTWRHVLWPRAWPLVTGAAMVVVMLSLTEVPATLVLLPPGVPNFAQRLLNQMHYARDQQTIASCLALAGVYVMMAAAVVAPAGWRRLRRGGAAATLVAPAALALAAALGAAGCAGTGGDGGGEVRVLGVIGTTGRGPGEFLYPRAIDIDADGNIFVADRTGRIQRLSPRGEALGVFRTPEFEKGYPTGLTVGPDGLVYVPDTHYHRVLAYEPGGRLVRQFGEFGTGDGQFIYPTDVALAAGRVYVSEYGGNDRVSVWTAEGRFLHSFGRPGTGQGELSRPQALAVDENRGRLYVADACNHRIVRYTLDGERTGEFGGVGVGPGQLRYPYGLSLGADGSLVVCEYGNNRLQVFDAEGRSLRLLGRAGRAPGELAYPWAVAATADGRAYVVDAGNNRVQEWAL
jgi:ABC-type Fe3+ transport system permease subunit/DNA-binding beta-propeller fold protein YncE